MYPAGESVTVLPVVTGHHLIPGPDLVNATPHKVQRAAHRCQNPKILAIVPDPISSRLPVLAEINGHWSFRGGLLGSLSGSDINADAADSSRSIRGLSPEAKEYAKSTGTHQQSQDALDSVILRKVKEQEIDQFLKQGKIGEYAE